MSQVKEVEIPVPWGVVRGKWWGPESEEPILFIHGWQDNCGSFDPLMALLPETLPRLCIDLPGHGYSSPYPKGQYYYLFWDGLVLVRRIVKHFGWSKISIVGHSLGGAIGFLYASSFPNEVDKYVSLDIACPRVANPSTIVKQTGDWIDRFLKYETLPPDSQPCYDYDEMVSVALQGYNGSVTRQGVQVLLKRGMRPAVASEGDGLSNGSAGSDPQSESSSKSDKHLFTRDVRLKVAGLGMPSLDIVLEMAEKITCDYLNIRAQDGLTFENPDVYIKVLQKIKNSCRSFRYHQVEGKHHVHLNHPERVAKFITNFLTGSSANGVVSDVGDGDEPVPHGDVIV